MPNFTIIVNWKTKGFGCTKACSYCNWRNSPLLPHGGQSEAAISAFISRCRKSFVTISGGGDPLYRFDENGPALLAMVKTIKAQGFKVRIITREVRRVAALRGIADYVSISLDDEVLRDIANHRQDWSGMDIEYSLVLPPLPAADLAALKPQYSTLRTQLGGRLVLRENLNSIYPMAQMSFGHKGIVFVPRLLCLDGRYLSTIDCTGHDIVQDNSALAGFLMNHSEVVLFGGFVKHLLEPRANLEYGDIDAIVIDPAVMDTLSERFAFTFKAVSPEVGYPRYFLGNSVRAGKTIQLVLMKSKSDALKFIFNAQYDLDRIGYSREFLFDPLVGEADIRRAVHDKTARLIQGPRCMDLFHASRSQIEQRHRAKLISKGFAVAP